MSKLNNCPFCGATENMIYKVEHTEPIGGFKYPALFCDACKATVYFEDSTSTGEDDKKDYDTLVVKLIEGWNGRG